MSTRKTRFQWFSALSTWSRICIVSLLVRILARAEESKSYAGPALKPFRRIHQATLDV